MEFKYKNITISGGVACGKGTLSRNLHGFLKSYGWQMWSGSQLAHTFAPQFYSQDFTDTKKAHHNALDYDDEVDKFIDDSITKKVGAENNLIVESWLSGFNCRAVPGVLRVLLYTSNPGVIIDRIVNRDHCTVAVAKQHLKDREDANFGKWRRLYGDHDFFDPKFYTVAIDTYSNGPLETAGCVLDALGFKI